MADKILFLAHTESDGSLSRFALEALAAARRVGGELTVGLVGARVTGAPDCGAAHYFAVEGEAFGYARYATDAAAAEALVRVSAASFIVAPHTSRWARMMAGVAQRLSGRIDTHVTAFETGADGPCVSRWFYRQRMEAVLERTARPWFLLVDSGVCPAFEPGAVPVPVEYIAVDPPTRTSVVGRQSPAVAQQTIRPDAPLLLVAGAGWTKKQKDGRPHVEDASRLILAFLEMTQASLGSSKSLVDIGGEGQAVLPFISHLNQVGQTGSTPRHAKGLATCCHGEQPHVVGWRFVKERRAINLDPNCGWARGKADVLYVADAFEVMERVNALLEAHALSNATLS